MAYNAGHQRVPRAEESLHLFEQLREPQRVDGGNTGEEHPARAERSAPLRAPARWASAPPGVNALRLVAVTMATPRAG
jgi:hypothetical protein